MKILFLSAANSNHTVKWVNTFSKRGHQVYLVCNKGHEPSENHINPEVKLHILKYGGVLGYYLNAFELAQYVKKIVPDVINVHYASGYGTLARISRISPYILSVWGSDVYEFPLQSRMKRYILEKNVNYATTLASTSNCMADQLKKVLDNQDLKIAITPFGVDLDRFSPALYADKNNHKKKKIVIGTVKALKPVYGIKELLLAFSDLKEKMVGSADVRLMVYGDGEQRTELERLIKELKLENSVQMPGKIPNVMVPEALSEFDIFCALSHRESFGVAAVEAMAMKKPVVVSKADGLQEVVEDGVTGYVVDVHDREGTVDRLQHLAMNPELRLQMGEAGRKRTELLYDWNKNVNQMLKLYESVRYRDGAK